MADFSGGLYDSYGFHFSYFPPLHPSGLRLDSFSAGLGAPEGEPLLTRDKINNAR
jgi:hypothetical protein